MTSQSANPVYDSVCEQLGFCPLIAEPVHTGSTAVVIDEED